MLVFMLILAIPFFFSCENPEGIGGTGSISGTLLEYAYNEDFTEELKQGPAIDEEVYILFGDEEAPGERVRTGPEGHFMIKYLYPGKYRIYYASEADNPPAEGGDDWEPGSAWVTPIEVSLGSGEDKDLGQLSKYSTLEFDDGYATIRGQVRRIKYVKNSYPPLVEYVDWAHEHEVYLTYGDHASYDERVRTSFDGTFEFRNLIPGDYLVYVFSEDIGGDTQHVVLKYEVTIDDWNQVYVFDQPIDVEAI